jgi:hypothetical protein
MDARKPDGASHSREKLLTLKRIHQRNIGKGEALVLVVRHVDQRSSRVTLPAALEHLSHIKGSAREMGQGGCPLVLIGNARVLIGGSRVLTGGSRTLTGGSRMLIGGSRTLIGSSRTLIGSSRTSPSENLCVEGFDEQNTQ